MRWAPLLALLALPGLAHADPPPLPLPPRNAKYFVAVRLELVGGDEAQRADLIDRALRALAKVPQVAVRLPNPAHGPPVISTARLAALHMTGWVVEGTLTLKPGHETLDCVLSGILATYPGAAIVKATVSTRAQVSGVQRGLERMAADQCLDTAATAIADHMRGFLPAFKKR